MNWIDYILVWLVCTSMPSRTFSFALTVEVFPDCVLDDIILLKHLNGCSSSVYEIMSVVFYVFFAKFMAHCCRVLPAISDCI